MRQNVCSQGCQPLFAKKADLIPQKSQIAVLGHIHIKRAWTNTKQILKLVRNIDIIQFQSLEAFSFPVITLLHICFWLNTSINFRATVKSLEYSLPDFVWLFWFPKKAECVKKARFTKSGFKKAKLATPPTTATWSEHVLPCICYAIKPNRRTIRSQIFQPASAGKGVDMCELHAHHYMTPEHVNLALVQCVSYRQVNRHFKN